MKEEKTVMVFVPRTFVIFEKGFEPELELSE